MSKCRSDEGCVETFNCQGGFITNDLSNGTLDTLQLPIDVRFNAKQKTCKEDFDGVHFVCCKYLTKVTEQVQLHIVSSYPDVRINMTPKVHQNNLLLKNESKVEFIDSSDIDTDHQTNKVQRFVMSEAKQIPNNDTEEITTTSTTEKYTTESIKTVNVPLQILKNNNLKHKYSQIQSSDLLTLPEIESRVNDKQNVTEEIVEAPQNLSLQLIPPVNKDIIEESNTEKIFDDTFTTNKPDDQEVVEFTTDKMEIISDDIASVNLISNVPVIENDTSLNIMEAYSVIDNGTEINNFEQSTNSPTMEDLVIEKEAQENENNPTEIKDTVETKNMYDNKRELYPFFEEMDDKNGYITNNETGEKIKVPSQYYEPPSLTPHDLLKYIFPPEKLELESLQQNDTSDVADIQLLSPLTRRNEHVVTECPQGMKCLLESYCATMNPAEGDSEAFDIRLSFRKVARRKRCRQPNLPTDGFCCYLREDYASMSIIIPPTKPPQDVSPKRSNEEACGIRRPPLSDLRDRSSTSTTFGEFPWQALILRNDIDNFTCGGAIINQQTIVTSAACVKNVIANNIRIRVGEWDMENNQETKPHQELTAKKILIHPGFKSINSNLVHDIALIVTTEKIIFDYHVSRICLPEPIDRFNDRRCIVTGWTSPQELGSTMTKSLKQLPLPIVSHGMCEQKLRTTLGRNFNLHRTSICAGGEPKIDSCMIHQHGAPLGCENAIGSYTLVGLTSWTKQCSQNLEPAVFTNVPIHTDWIHIVLQKETSDIHF